MAPCCVRDHAAGARTISAKAAATEPRKAWCVSIIGSFVLGEWASPRAVRGLKGALSGEMYPCGNQRGVIGRGASPAAATVSLPLVASSPEAIGGYADVHSLLTVAPEHRKSTSRARHRHPLRECGSEFREASRSAVVIEWRSLAASTGEATSQRRQVAIGLTAPPCSGPGARGGRGVRLPRRTVERACASLR